MSQSGIYVAHGRATRLIVKGLASCASARRAKLSQIQGGGAAEGQRRFDNGGGGGVAIFFVTFYELKISLFIVFTVSD